MILSRDYMNTQFATPWVNTPRQSKVPTILKLKTFSYNGKKEALTASVVSNIQTYNVSNKISKVKWIDDEGEIAPALATQSSARLFISDFYRSLVKRNLQWKDPLTNASPDKEIVFEWWNGQKKLTVYCKENSLEFIKVWGADIESEMDDGEVSAEIIPELADWLWS